MLEAIHNCAEAYLGRSVSEAVITVPGESPLLSQLPAQETSSPRV